MTQPATETAPWRAPFATADLPGTGGLLRAAPEDFRVEEIPLYEPVGEGEHVYLRIEKRGLATIEAADRIARALGVPPSTVGYAGLKDARAVTTQLVSVHGITEEAAAGLDLPGIKVLEVRRHRNKLKRGHLSGNRFRITVREIDAGADGPARAGAVLERLAARGVPNLFGRQRFGSRGNTHRLGRAVAAGDGRSFYETLIGGQGEPGAAALERLRAGDAAGARDALPPGMRIERRALDALVRGGDPDSALRRIDRRYRSLYLGALQSELFNAVLVERFGELDGLREGDLAWLHRNGAVFLVEDLAAELPRAAAFEISASGPLFGPKMTWPSGEVAALEARVASERGIDARDLAPAGRAPRGARRPLRVPVAEPEVTATEDGDLVVSFALPPGAYATVVLREITKCEDGDAL